MQYLKLLFWLKGILMLRGFRRSRASAVGLVIAGVVFLPIALGIAFVCWLGSGALVLLVVVLFLFHTLSLSQAAILASSSVLRSRRFRDIAVVLIPLFWMSYYILSRTLAGQLAHVKWRGFLQSPFWEALSFLP